MPFNRLRFKTQEEEIISNAIMLNMLALNCWNVFFTCSGLPTGCVVDCLQVGSDSMGNVKRREVFESVEKAGNKRHKTITDVNTQEVIAEYWENNTSKPVGRPVGKKVHFIKIYKTNWLDIAKTKMFTPYEVGIFALLLAFLDWQSPYLVDPNTGKNLNESEIAEILQIDRAQLHNTIQSLVDKGIIAKISKGNGRPNHFMINTNIAFHGNTIRDLNDHTVFAKDCNYKPIVEVKYSEAKKK